MSSHRTDEGARADTEEDSHPAEFESWLQKAARLPNAAIPRLPEKGQVVGEKYRIEEELGRGGMGAVFRATHTVSGKAVALKWLLRPISDERAVERFTREARAAGRIDHPNVVDIYDLGREGDASFLVMELLHGESLRSRLTRGALEPAEAADLLLPAMRGVEAAHHAGVIHRDLKPDNIFLCRARNGEPRPAKVLDFGISTITSTETNYSALTTEGTLLGTPSYIAPEQLESAVAPDVRTDVYAFGVMLYEALTGRVPFIADNYLGLALAIAKHDPVKPRKIKPEIPEAVERVVMQAMSKNPKDRPQTMTALIAALAPFAGAARGPDAREHVSGKRLRPDLPVRWHKWAWLSAALVLVAISTAAWYLRAHRQSAEEDSEKNAANVVAPPPNTPAASLVPSREEPASPPASADHAPPPSAAASATPSASERALPEAKSSTGARTPARKRVQLTPDAARSSGASAAAKTASEAPAPRPVRAGAIRADEL